MAGAATAFLVAALALAACSGASDGDSGGASGGDSAPLNIDERWTAICEAPLAPGQGVPSAERFRTADEGLAEMDQLLESEDLNGASSVFFSQVHDLTHDIDGALRGTKPALAKDLCAIIGQMEADFAGGEGASSLKALAGRARELMREASNLLGYSE